MAFLNFTDRYYSSQQQKEIISLLQDLRIYSELEILINEFYRAAESENKNGIISQFVLSIKEFVETVNLRLLNIKPGREKLEIENIILELSTFLIRDTYQFSGLEMKEYFELLKLTIKKTYVKNSWDFSIIENPLNLHSSATLLLTEKKNTRSTAIKTSKAFQLKWQSDIQLDLFVDDLVKTFVGIKSKKQIFLLFNTLETDFKIELPSKHLVGFLSLFYLLHSCGVIKVIGNRGLFVYLHQHLQAPENDRYPNRDFRKLRYEANQNKISKSKILKSINPLLEKYCLLK